MEKTRGRISTPTRKLGHKWAEEAAKSNERFKFLREKLATACAASDPSAGMVIRDTLHKLIAAHAAWGYNSMKTVCRIPNMILRELQTEGCKVEDSGVVITIKWATF
jgi:hypothetical protein